MKRFFQYLSLSFLAVALVVCCAKTREIDPGEKASEKQGETVSETITFRAVLEVDTKTALGAHDFVCWSTGDCIRVFNESHLDGEEYTLQSGAGTLTGTFTGPQIGEGPYWAVYPSSAAGSLASGVIQITIPSTQTYAENSFGPGANVAAGKADELDGILFHNLMGALALTLTGTQSIGSIRILSYAQEPLYGTASVIGLEVADTPVLTFGEGQADEAHAYLTLDCGEDGVALSEEGKTFYLIVPAGRLAEGYMIEVYDKNGEAMARYAKVDEANGIARREILEMPALSYTPDCKAEFLQSSAIGAFSGAKTGGDWTALCTYSELQSQYAYKNTETTRYLRLEDMADGYALGVTMPKTLNPGKSETITIEQATGLPSLTEGTPKMRVVKVSDGKVWLLDRSAGTGFILMMVEEE